MGKVKSEMFEDDLSADDELVPKRSSDDIVKEIEQCEIPRGTQERREFMHEKLKELMDGINSK
jgi:hypothetical protein